VGTVFDGRTHATRDSASAKAEGPLSDRLRASEPARPVQMPSRRSPTKAGNGCGDRPAPRPRPRWTATTFAAFASALIAGGASVKQVQVVLGHQSAVVTLRIYAHLWPGGDDRTRAVMEGTLNGLRTVSGLE